MNGWVKAKMVKADFLLYFGAKIWYNK